MKVSSEWDEESTKKSRRRTPNQSLLLLLTDEPGTVERERERSIQQRRACLDTALSNSRPFVADEKGKKKEVSDDGREKT